MSELIGRLISNPLVTALGVGFAAVVTSLWLASCWWAYRDAARRTESALGPYLAAAWVFLSTPVMLPASVLIYGLVRPQEALGDRRSHRLLQALERAAVDGPACPRCGAWTDESWVRCPACRGWLASACPQCRRPAPLDAEVCPWCAWAPGNTVLPDGGSRRVVEESTPAALDDTTVAAARPIAAATAFEPGAAVPGGEDDRSPQPAAEPAAAGAVSPEPPPRGRGSRGRSRWRAFGGQAIRPATR